ncbi:MAG: hypothetical protein ACTSRA_19590 [Promethearchaeota archaeon]
MLTYILSGVMLIYCAVRRLLPNGRVVGVPMGMPRNTIRAIVTVLILSIPLDFLLRNKEVPDLVVNSMFTLIAFYFQSRKGSDDRTDRIINELISIRATPVKTNGNDKEILYPLYLPKYWVRGILVILVLVTFLYNLAGPNISFMTVNTMYDLLSIILFFFVGLAFRTLTSRREKQKIHATITKLREAGQMSDFEILETLITQPSSPSKRRLKSLLSLLILIAFFISMALYSMDLDFVFFRFVTYEISARNVLFLVINAYYGYRD